MAGKQKLFIHGGFPKTATTAVQHGLAQNQALLERQGFVYPYSDAEPFCYYYQHAPLAAALYGNWAKWIPQYKHKTRKKAVSRFLRAAARHPDKAIVISSEYFTLRQCSAASVARAVGLLGDFDITFVAYIRRQDDHLVSSVQQKVAGASLKDFDLDTEIGNLSRRYQAVEIWRNALGAENVVVRPFTPDLMHPDGVLADFVQSIGCDPSGLEPAPRINESIDLRTIPVLLDINRTLGKAKLSNEPTRSALQIAAKAMDSERKDFRRPRLSARQAEKVENAFRDINRDLISDEDYKIFFRPRETAEHDLTFESPPEEREETLIALTLKLAALSAEAHEKLRALQIENSPRHRKWPTLRRRLSGIPASLRRRLKSRSRR